MSIAIDPSHRDDPFYRYRMDVLELMHEGRGNGRHTAIMNLDKIAKDIDIPAPLLLKHLQYELGSKAAFRDGRAVINGTHSKEDLQACIDTLITNIILCGVCNNPEVILGGKRQLKRACKACGETTVVKSTLRITDVIHKHAQCHQKMFKKKEGSHSSNKNTQKL